MRIFQFESKLNLNKRAHTYRKQIETKTNAENPLINEHYTEPTEGATAAVDF